MKNRLVLFLSLLILFSCNPDSADDQKPIITITSPTNGQTFTAGLTVNIAGTITDNDEIHGVHLHIINIGTGVHLLLFDDHPDVKTYNLNKSFTAQAGASYQILLEADDHSGNHASTDIRVTGN